MIVPVCPVVSSATNLTLLGHQCCRFQQLNTIDVTSYTIQVLNCTIMHSYGIDLDKYSHPYSLLLHSTYHVYTIHHGIPLNLGYPILPYNLYTRRFTVVRTHFTFRYTLHYNLVVTLPFHSSTLSIKTRYRCDTVSFPLPHHVYLYQADLSIPIYLYRGDTVISRL